LMRLRLKPDMSTRPPKKRADDYEEFRRKCAMVKPDELKDLFEENLEARKNWLKVAKDKAEESMLKEMLKEGTWDSAGWKKFRGPLDDGSLPTDAVTVFFPGSALGVGLGFALGVNYHLDAMFRTLGTLDDELFLLGNYLCDEIDAPGLCWIQGPLKKLKDAFEKTVFRDYKGNAVENKDLVRGTVVTNTTDPKKNQELLPQVVARIEKICTPEFGINILTAKEKREAKPKVGDPKDCGYSGWNYKILFNGHPKVADPGDRPFGDVGKGWAEGTTLAQDTQAGPIPCEIQVNTREMMFGKHSMSLLLKMKVFKDAGEYTAHEKAVGFQGGLGHVCYEIGRSASAGADGLAAAALARDYHDICRTVPYGGDKAGLDKLNKDLQEFSGKLTDAKAKKLWDDHFDVKWKDGKTLSAGAESRKKTW
ncbi:MAG: hypothetical protein ACAI25_07000, partial [Planctomycetota bacterium]